MLIGIAITLISMYFQQKFFKQNERWREENRAFIMERKEEFIMPGYTKKSTITVFFISLGLLVILISLVCKFIMW